MKWIVALVLQLSWVIMGCKAEPVPAIVINASGHPITVSFSRPRHISDSDGRRSICMIGKEWMDSHMAVGTHVKRTQWKDWSRATPTNYDEESCTASYIVPAQASFVVHGVGCKFKNLDPAFYPLDFLRVEGRERTLEYRGPDTDKPFSRHGGFWNRQLCTFEFR